MDSLHQGRQRVLEIRATLAEWKADYLNRGVERPYGQRAELQQELAALELAVFKEQAAANAAKKAASDVARGTLLTCLVQVCNERGCGNLVGEAMRRSAALAAPVNAPAVAATSGSHSRHD